MPMIELTVPTGALTDTAGLRRELAAGAGGQIVRYADLVKLAKNA